ncbi:asparaginase [Micromonospora sp. M12]
MNCSGKHAAMLVACVARSWSTHDYLDPEHPLQRKPPPPSPGWPARRSRTTLSTAAAHRCSACR